MESHKKKFKVRLGLFIAGGLALFIIGIFLIGKQQNMFNSVFKLTSTFYNVSGLQVGNNVRFSGINVGVVDNINIINDSTVMVHMLIKENVKEFIRSDAMVALGSEGLIGARLIMITQGSSAAPVVEEGQHLKSIEPVEIDDIIASLHVTAGHAETITQELVGIMFQVNSGEGTLGKLIHDSSIADNMSQTTANLERGSKGITEIISQVNSGEGTLGKLLRDSSIADNIIRTTVNLEKGSEGLTEIMSQVNSGEGTIGRLLHDTSMADNINQTVDNLEKSSKKLDETMEAVKNSFLFRGFFRKKAKKEKQEKEAVEKNKDVEIQTAEIKAEEGNM